MPAGGLGVGGPVGPGGPGGGPLDKEEDSAVVQSRQEAHMRYERFRELSRGNPCKYALCVVV